MKMQSTLRCTFLFFGLVLVILVGCKKYEEDDYWFTLRSVNKRLVGKKELVECTYNGADSMAFFKRYFGDFYFDLRHEDLKPDVKNLIVYNTFNNQQIGSGFWNSDVNKQNQATRIAFWLKNLGILIYGSPSFYITKLTKREFHLECDSKRANE